MLAVENKYKEDDRHLCPLLVTPTAAIAEQFVGADGDKVHGSLRSGKPVTPQLNFNLRQQYERVSS